MRRKSAAPEPSDLDGGVLQSGRKTGVLVERSRDTLVGTDPRTKMETSSPGAGLPQGRSPSSTRRSARIRRLQGRSGNRHRPRPDPPALTTIAASVQSFTAGTSRVKNTIPRSGTTSIESARTVAPPPYTWMSSGTSWSGKPEPNRLTSTDVPEAMRNSSSPKCAKSILSLAGPSGTAMSALTSAPRRQKWIARSLPLRTRPASRACRSRQSSNRPETARPGMRRQGSRPAATRSGVRAVPAIRGRGYTPLAIQHQH